MVTKIPETSDSTKINGKKRKAKTEMNRPRKGTCKSNKMSDRVESTWFHGTNFLRVTVKIDTCWPHLHKHVI